MNKMISVVLPVYNGENRVSKSIESVLSQTYTNLELIIVNDCSTDGTEEIIRHYKEFDKRVRIIENSTNQKLPKSLNNGFRAAKGEYLTWTSDDNAYHTDALEIMASELDKNPKIDMVYTDFTKVDMEGNVIEKVKLLDPDQLRFGNAVGACFLYS